MEQSLHEQITQLLAHIDAERSEEPITGAVAEEGTCITTGNSEHARRPRRVVNVYIDIQEDAHETQEREDAEDTRADVPIIESTLDRVDEMPQTAARSTPPIASPLPHHQRRVQKNSRARLVPIVMLILCLLVIGILTTHYVFALLAPTAIVTIVPVSTAISTTATLHVVTGSANPTTATPHLSGLVLASVTMNRAQTIPTTGMTHQEARAGTGRITFYNAAPYVQTIPAGTLMTGADGVQVVTDEDAVIPAVSYPTLGQATVSAHATITGPLSNIGARDLYGPCCRLNVSAVNSAFGGGQNARTYQTVSQEDRKTVTSSLKASLDASTQAALQAQVHTDETLLTPLACQEHTTADHEVGDEAQQLHITMSETCMGIAYHTQAAHDLALQIVSQAATKHLGEGYRRVGEIQITTNTTTATGHGDSELHLTIAGTWAYQFTERTCEQIKALLAGKSKAQAITTVLQVPGVESASVSIENATTLPTDIQHIQVAVIQILP
jgi:hypothetical protein